MVQGRSQLEESRYAMPSNAGRRTKLAKIALADFESSNNNHFHHPPARTARKPVLETAGHRESQPRQRAPWPGNGIEHVRDISAGAVEFEEKSLLALFDVHCGGG